MTSFAVGMFEILGIYMGFVVVIVVIALMCDKNHEDEEKGEDNE